MLTLEYLLGIAYECLKRKLDAAGCSNLRHSATAEKMIEGNDVLVGSIVMFAQECRHLLEAPASLSEKYLAAHSATPDVTDISVAAIVGVF